MKIILGGGQNWIRDEKITWKLVPMIQVSGVKVSSCLNICAMLVISLNQATNCFSRRIFGKNMSASIIF